MGAKLHHEDGRTLEVKPPYLTAPFAEAAEEICSCGGVRVVGKNLTHDYDTYRSSAYCADCQSRVGELVARVATIFGIDEDIRVLNGRCRVY